MVRETGLPKLDYELAVGAVVGVAVGYAGAWGVRRIALPASGLYPIAVMALCCAAYGAAAVIHASGFLAVYLAGLVLGNARLPHRPATRGFVEGLAWLAQIGLFVMLGLAATPLELGPSLLPALGIGIVLLTVARPLSVLVALGPFGRHAPATPFPEGVDEGGPRTGGSPRPGPSAGSCPGRACAGRCRSCWRPRRPTTRSSTSCSSSSWCSPSCRPRRCRPSRDASGRRGGRDAAPRHRVVTPDAPRRGPPAGPRPPGSRLAGVEVVELSLPEGASVTLVVRDGRAFVPRASTPLQVGDDLILVATDAARPDVERRLRAVSLGGRLADWHHPYRRRPGRRA